jgi:hypothetical protein
MHNRERARGSDRMAKSTTRKRKVDAKKAAPAKAERNDAVAVQDNWRKTLQAGKIKFDDKAKARYLESLAQDGRKMEACKAAGVVPSTVQSHKDNDPDFLEQWDVAEQTYRDRLIGHHQTLIFEGEETIIFDIETGKIKSRTVKFPIRLIELELKKVDPAYRDKQQIEHGAMGGGVLVAPAGMEPMDWLEHQDTVNNGRGDEAPDRSKPMIENKSK